MVLTHAASVAHYAGWRWRAYYISQVFISSSILTRTAMPWWFSPMILYEITPPHFFLLLLAGTDAQGELTSPIGRRNYFYQYKRLRYWYAMLYGKISLIFSLKHFHFIAAPNAVLDFDKRDDGYLPILADFSIIFSRASDIISRLGYDDFSFALRRRYTDAFHFRDTEFRAGWCRIFATAVFHLTFEAAEFSYHVPAHFIIDRIIDSYAFAAAPLMYEHTAYAAARQGSYFVFTLATGIFRHYSKEVEFEITLCDFFSQDLLNRRWYSPLPTFSPAPPAAALSPPPPKSTIIYRIIVFGYILAKVSILWHFAVYEVLRQCPGYRLLRRTRVITFSFAGEAVAMITRIIIIFIADTLFEMRCCRYQTLLTRAWCCSIIFAEYFCTFDKFQF